MNEFEPKPSHELWYDGPNYTADAVIVDPTQTALVLIQRQDTGEWALPGGFVEPDEPAELAAMREAFEEAAIILLPSGRLIYQGVVDDPRNSDQAWIETSAYLFLHTSDTQLIGGDDAAAAQWWDIHNLPPLYASHAAIVAAAQQALEIRGVT